MFTGIVDHCGIVKEILNQKNHCKIWLKTEFNDLTLGESICVDGICLTVTDISDNQFSVDVSPETIAVTTIKNFQKETKVNLERSLRIMDRMGGHFVTGHIDGQCVVAEIKKFDEFTEMTFSHTNSEYLVKKGSVAINGVSLTINDVVNDQLKVMLIPHTLQRTNLSTLRVGHFVNVEYDYLAKLVLKQVSHMRPETA